MAALDLVPPLKPARVGRNLIRNSAATAVLVVMILFVLYPLALLLYGSFLNDTGTGVGQQLGLDNWITAWAQSPDPSARHAAPFSPMASRSMALRPATTGIPAAMGSRIRLRRSRPLPNSPTATAWL